MLTLRYAAAFAADDIFATIFMPRRRRR